MKYILSLALFCLISELSAQDIKVSKGDFETNFSSVINRGEVALDLRFGAFVADYTQLGLKVGYSDTDFLTQSQLGVYLLRFFETRTYTLPYVGLGMGYTTLEADGAGDNSGVDFALILGLRYYIADNVALNTEFRSAWATDKTFIDSDRAVDTDFGLRIGLSYLW